MIPTYSGGGLGRSGTWIIGFAICLLLTFGLDPSPLIGQNETRVVTTLPTYAAIAREIAGEFASVEAIARGDEDPHFVNPRPSYAATLQRADIFVATGLDLELWVPAVMNRANNSSIAEGSSGHVVAYAGIQLLDVPEDVSRTGGDVHVFGNPHIHTDPINGIQIARNIHAALKRIDPANTTSYDENLASFEHRVMERLFGAEFVQLLGAETILDLARGYELWSFAQAQQYQGRPLTDFLGGWMGDAVSFRGQSLVCYHKNWNYFSARFGVECSMYVEPQPGIPPSPGHVRDVVDFIDAEGIQVILAANYFSRNRVEQVASRTGALAVVVPEHVGGAEGIDDYFALIDSWVTQLAAAFGGEQ